MMKEIKSTMENMVEWNAEQHALFLKVKEQVHLERLRDEFAMRLDIRSACDENGYLMEVLAYKMMNGVGPKGADQPWWDEAEMRYRYMKADAALKAREIK